MPAPKRKNPLKATPSEGGRIRFCGQQRASARGRTSGDNVLPDAERPLETLTAVDLVPRGTPHDEAEPAVEDGGNQGQEVVEKGHRLAQDEGDDLGKNKVSTEKDDEWRRKTYPAAEHNR